MVTAEVTERQAHRQCDKAVKASSIVGCQRMVHHVFLRDDFGYFRFAVNSASDCQFSRLIIPILDFRHCHIGQE